MEKGSSGRGQDLSWGRRDRAERVSRKMGLGLMAVEVMGVGEQSLGSRLG